MRLPHRETTEMLLRRRIETGESYEEMRKTLGIKVSRGTISRAARGIGPISRNAENDIRCGLGLPPLRGRKRFRPDIPLSVKTCLDRNMCEGETYGQAIARFLSYMCGDSDETSPQ